MAVTGLQRNVIAMAFWCKSDGGQHQGILPPPIATQHRYYGRFITVLRRDWVVVAGLRIRLTGWSARTTSDTVLRCRLVTSCHGRCLYIGLASACAFTTTLMTLSDTLIHSNAKGWCRKSSSLHPRLFRGVTPYRHDGESSVRAYLTLACTFRLPGWGSSINGTHPDRCGTCAICRTVTHLKAHSTVWI